MRTLSGSFSLFLLFLFSWPVIAPTHAQDTLTGAFEGRVTNSLTGAPVAGALAEITNIETNLVFTKRTDTRGRFYQGLLPPGVYRIRVSLTGFQTSETLQRLNIARTGEVVPIPVSLDPLPPGTTPAVTPPPITAPAPGTTPAPTPSTAATDLRARINTTEASRGNSFTETEVSALPLGSVTLTRTFDELALLLPGVAPPPQTRGTVVGPGQGAGVGTAGQFAVNGLRSRGNNFTVDGSDNNDEDIGVRRQGFLALTPQPIESIKEYQATTLLAPAQFGRNFGAIVNAVSKSGGSQLHGTLYGFFNASQLNWRNRFDSDLVTPLVRGQSLRGQELQLEGRPFEMANNAGGEDSFTFGQFGATLGGPLRRERTFFFLAAEGQLINARQEEHFAVPTIEQRGSFASGATGLASNPFPGGGALAARPTSGGGDAFFSLYPFPNQPDGVYGPNTFTQVLPASARGAVFSAKLDHNFELGKRAQSVTGRYNFTDDWRELAKTGEAIFSTLRPEVRAQNFSFYFNSQLSAPEARQALFNQVRLSYGRTRLRFLEVRPCVAVDVATSNECTLQSDAFPNEPFLLNRPLIENPTRPTAPGQPFTGPIALQRVTTLQTGAPLNSEFTTGPLGQVLLAGFSPLGVDVFNFPQQRVNNTYQMADVLTWSVGAHRVAAGADARRTELNSDLRRIFRPLVTFNGAPLLDLVGSVLQPLPATAAQRFFRPEDLAAAGAASNFFLTVRNGRDDAALHLRFYQLNFFAQDNWRLRPNLTLGLGLRYEYNTVPREAGAEANQFVEQSFNAPELNLIRCPAGTPAERCGLRPFLAGRTELFDPDRNNFAPRVSLVYAPQWFGRERATVLRAGFGVFFDQVLGAVVSQSRNAYPSFLTLNFGGFFATGQDVTLGFFNPSRANVGTARLTTDLNRLNIPLAQLEDALFGAFPNTFGATLPARDLATPTALHYSFAFEQQLNAALTASLAYVGTQGRHLLRFVTPNLGPAANLIPRSLAVSGAGRPIFRGQICTPAPSGNNLCSGRPTNGVGAVNLFETAANSRYDSLQVELRSRLRGGLQLQAAYVFSAAQDDVSDVFDLAGAFALPQNSLQLGAERGPANFDVRHRGTFALVYDVPTVDGGRWAWLRNGLQLASIGRLQTGQPFTVNSVFDINLDGNLTDRLNSTDGLVITGNGRQPLVVNTTNLTALLATPGQDGRSGRNTFRAGGLVEVDLSVSKAFRFAAQRRLLLRADFFNLFNQANYAIPVRLLEAPGFGRATSTVTPGLRVQFGLKLEF